MTPIIIAMTSSLVGYFVSLFFGTLVFVGLAAFFIIASQQDKIAR